MLAEGGFDWRTVLGVDDETLYKNFSYCHCMVEMRRFSEDWLGAWEYDIVAPYYKCNMTDIMAAIGMAQFERYAGMLSGRQEIIRRYNEALATIVRKHRII